MRCIECSNAQFRDESDAGRDRVLREMSKHGFSGCRLHKATFRDYAREWDCPSGVAAPKEVVDRRIAWAERQVK